MAQAARMRAEHFKNLKSKYETDVMVNSLRHAQQQAEIQNQVRRIDGLLLGLQPHHRLAFIQNHLQDRRTHLHEHLDPEMRATLNTQSK